MRIVWLDTETYHATLDLRQVGLYKYSEEAELLLLSWAYGNGDVRLWDATQEDMPEDLAQLLNAWKTDDSVRYAAFNASFDRVIIRETLDIDIPPERWLCLMTLANTATLPGKLETWCRELGLGEDYQKDARGRRLINVFCKPAPSNHKAVRYTVDNKPEEWQEFCEYSKQDVVSMRAAAALTPKWNFKQPWNQMMYVLGERMNERGLPIDMEFVQLAQAATTKEFDKLSREVVDMTHGVLTSTNQVGALGDYLREAFELEVPNLQAPTVEELLTREDLEPDCRRLLQIRAWQSKTSVAKYDTLLRAVGNDDRLRGGFQYYGAHRTGRFAGRLFQPQNLTRPNIEGDKDPDINTAVRSIFNGTVDILYDTPMDVLASCVRGSIIAPGGKRLVVADLVGIEGRVLPWLCHFQEKLDKIEAGVDMYKEAYAGTFGVAPEDVDKDQRFVGKVEELSFGYQGAVGAFRNTCKSNGVECPFETDEEIVQVVRGWRKNNSPIVGFWYDSEAAVKSAIKNPGKVFKVGRIYVSVQSYKGRHWLLAKLPSGRLLHYFNPRIRDNRVLYRGYHPYTHHWGDVYSYGGKFVENFTQAVAYDVLVEGMLAAEAEGFEIVGTVHDEVISLSSTDGSDVLCEILTRGAPWAEGLPLSAEGFESDRYRK